MKPSHPSLQAPVPIDSLLLEFVRIDCGTLVEPSEDRAQEHSDLTVMSSSGVVEVVGTVSLDNLDEWDRAVVSVRSTGATGPAKAALTVSLFNYLTGEFEAIGGGFSAESEPYTVSLPARLDRRSPHVDHDGSVRIRLGYAAGEPTADEYCCVIHVAQVSNGESAVKSLPTYLP